MSKLLGIFGGTFDPIHLGHLQAIEVLQKELNFTAIHWVLSARPPHKQRTSASIPERFAMLQLALQSYPNYIASDCEINRPQSSYTIDTVAEFAGRYPAHRVCLIIGGDSLLKLPSWHRYEELIEMVNFVVMARPGYQLEPPAELQSRVVDSVFKLQHAEHSAILLVERTNFAISSTKIRQLLAQPHTEQRAQQLQKLLPRSVYDYIQEQQSYTLAPMQPEQIKDHVVTALEDLKGQNIRVIEIADISDFADYMVVVSGTSDTHVKALAREASNKLRKLDVKPLNEDGADLGEWVLVDFGDVVLHVMRPEVREYYDLEKLWDEDVRELVKQHREEQDA